MRRILVLALALIAGVPYWAQSTSPDTDHFSRLRVFAGKWKGEQSGQPGKGVSEREYELVLGGRFLQARNTSTYPPQEKNKAGEVHHDMGMIGFDKARGRLVFRQFHEEGFVNTYVEEEGGDPKRILFVTESIENIPAGWRARETYTFFNDNEFVERFELAEPGKEYELYSEAHLRRVR